MARFSGLETMISTCTPSSGQSTPNITALLDAVFIQTAFFIFLGAAQTLPGTGMT